MSLSQIRNVDYAILLCNKMEDTRGPACLSSPASGIRRVPCGTGRQGRANSTGTDRPARLAAPDLFFRDPEDNIIEIYADY